VTSSSPPTPAEQLDRPDLPIGAVGRHRDAHTSSQRCQRPRERRAARRTAACSCPSFPPVLGHLHRHLDAVVGAEIGPEQAEPDQHRPPATALALNKSDPCPRVVVAEHRICLHVPAQRHARPLVRTSPLWSRADLAVDTLVHEDHPYSASGHP
jgi:hypothetical protein